MAHLYCPGCGPDWDRAYTLDHRCETCLSRLRVADHREAPDVEPDPDRAADRPARRDLQRTAPADA